MNLILKKNSSGKTRVYEYTPPPPPINVPATVVLKIATFTSTIMLNYFTSSETKELRLNYDLCDEEKDYLKIRKNEILKNISKINNLSQVPNSVNEVRSSSL